MLTALLRWMNQSRKDQRNTHIKTSRQCQSPEALFRFACDSCVPDSLRQLWQGELPSRTLLLEAFEDRVLFSAAPTPAPAPIEVVVVASLHADASTPETVPLPIPEIASAGAMTDTRGIPASTPGTSDTEQATGAILVVIDPSVPDYESLLDQLRQQHSGPMEVLVLDTQRDGLEQIADRLEQLGQTRAIHIVSHGDEAGLHLGSNWLSADTIAMRSNTLAQWQGLLTADADVLFYGCDLAANPSGQEFLRTFGQLTGADVGASTDATGAAILGGDWNLEFQYGDVETRSLGESTSLFEWNGLLTTNTYQQGVSSYTGTQDTTISAATPGTGNGASSTVTIGGASAKTGLIRFDSLFGNGPGQIPLGSTIHSASLRVNVTTGTTAESTITLHRVLANWSEASTWNMLGNGLSRDDVEVATVADSLVTGTTATGFQTITGLEESLQAWSDGETNNGWALFGDHTSAWTFRSSEGATSTQRPMLIVDFTPPTAAPTGELLATGETRVNVATSNSQSTAINGRNSHDAVGVDANGNYVIVWTSDPGDGSGAGVYGQRFNSRGLAQGGQFRVNQTTTDNQQWASVAMKADGGFIVTWTSQNQDGDGQGVYARIFTAEGVGGTEFRVNSTTTGTQQASALGVAADGSFVIAWEGNGTGDTAGIFAQRFDAAGAMQGSEIQVNTTTANTQYDPTIAVGQDGQFMVVWDDSIGTSGRRFNANGTARDASQITLHTDVTSGNADVATNGTGDYHIVWRTTGGGDGSGRAIWRMSLGSTDNAATALFQVPANSINDQTEPAITSNGDGDFIVTWQGAGPGDTAGVFARKFRSDGTAVGTEFQLNETVSGSQIAVSAAIVDLDNFVTVWSGNGPGDATGIFSHVYGTMGNRSALLFTTANDVVASGNPDLTAWTTGDVVSFQQPHLLLGDNTTATLGIAGRLNASNDGGVKIEGLDFIQSDVLVGSGANSIQLYAGDVLFSVHGTESFGPLTIQSDDIAVFRPAAPWNYSAGSIFVLFDGMESVAGGAIQQRADFDLVDCDTQVGDVLLRAGDLVIGDTGGAGNTIHVFQATGAGNSTTSGTAFTLLDATGLNLIHKIQGVHLIERDVRIGATTLHSGELLLTTDQSTTIGGNSLAITENDVVRLLVEQTSVNGPANTTASIVIDGSDLALDSNAEALKSLAFTSVGTPPTVNDDTYHLTEDETFHSANLWYDTNWSSRTQLTFNNASRAENLDDFPILVTLDTNRFDYSLAKANGEDLRFVDANGQLLSHEIETWDPSGRSSIWVKVPRIDASSSTDSIHLYYGNAAAADIQNPTAVWSNGYVGVWHLNGDPSGTQTIADSSSSNKDGTSIGMNATNQVSGPIGGALKFDGSTEAIRIDSTGTDPLAITGNNLTVEAWVNSTGSTGDWETILNRRNIVVTPIQSYGLKTALVDQSQVVHTTGTPDLTGVAGALPDDQWKYLTGVLSGSTSNLYVNGIQNATGTTLSFGSSNEDVTIGAAEAGVDSVLSQYWKGGIDEVRLSNVARSAAWTAAQYASMTDTLITYGERQTVAGLLDNDQSATTGGLVVSSVDLSDLTGGATAMVLDDGQVRFIPGTGFQNLADGQSVSQQITYTAMDSNGNTDTATATFVIHGVNDAPQMNTLVGPLKLSNVDEGSTNPAGNTVLAVLTSAAGTLITDVDSGAVQGMAVTAVDSTNGTWQYSGDGTTWLSLTGVSDTNATLLNTTSHVRFVPSAGFSGVAGAMTFRAWDQTTGTNVQTGVNVSTNGGSTAFSLQTTTASISVTPTNTPPVVVTNIGVTTSEGGTVLLSNSRLAASDAENTPAQLTYTLSASPTNGRIERVATPGMAITTFTQADLDSNAIRYVHHGGENTSDGFSFSLSDGAATVTGSFSITVTPVNDTPVVSANTVLTVVEGGNGILTTARLSASDSDNTAAQLTYTVSTIPVNGRVERVATPGVTITSFTQAEINSHAIRYVHNGGETTSDSFSFTLGDGAATVTGSFAITVTSVNDAPVVSTNTGLTLGEGATATIGNTKLSASDPDNTTAQRVYTVTAGPTRGRLEKSSNPGVSITSFTQANIDDGIIRYVHDGGETTSDSFSFSLSDATATVTGSFALTITAVNDTPVIAVNTGLMVVEAGSGALANTILLASDPDNTAAQLVYTVTIAPLHGRLERIAAPGAAITTFIQAEINSSAIRYVHDGSQTTADTFGFSLSDGTATVSGSLPVTITPVNNAPSLETNQLTITEGQAMTLSSSSILSSDPDTLPASLTYTVTAVTHGRFEFVSSLGAAITSFTQDDINSSRVRFVHSGGEAALTASISVSDGMTSVGPTVMLVAFTNVNDLPTVTTNTGMTLSEGATSTIANTHLAASDPDNTAAQRVFTVTVSPLHGRLETSTSPGIAITSFTQAQIDSGIIRYVHNGGETTADSLNFSLSDGTASVTGVFAIAITPTNDAPVIAANVALIASEGGAVSISSANLSSTDAETGPASLSYTVTGGLGFGHLALASAPGAAITSFTQAQINSNQIVYVHEGAESTADYFMFSVSDGALVATGTMAITMTSVDDAPTFDANQMTLTEGQTLVLGNINLLSNDSDTPATALVYTVNSVTNGRFENASAPGLAITSFSQDDVTNSRVVFVHNGSEAAPTATLTVTDGVTSVGPHAMLMTFSNVNDSPVISANTGVILPEGATTTIGSTRLAASDPDHTPAQRVYTVTTSPTHGRLERSNNAGVAITSFTQAEINDERIRYVHDGSNTITDGFGFAVTDGVTTVNGTFGITITAVNDPPLLTASSITVSEGQAVTLTLADINASDEDSASLTFSVSGLSRGQFKDTTTGQSVASFTRTQVQTGQIRFVHDGSENIPSAVVSVSDSVSSTTPVAITFAFSNVNDPPIALADTVTMSGTSEIVLSPSILLANDSDAEHNPLTITITRQPNHGTLVSHLDGTFTYRPELGNSGNDSFEYVVSDGNAFSAAAVVSFNVAVIGPSTSNSSGSTSSNSNSSSPESGATESGSSSTSQAASGSTTSTTSDSLIVLSPSGSLSGTGTSSSETEVFAFISHIHDEDGLGLFLARPRNGIEEVTQRARTAQEFEALRPNSRSGVATLSSIDSLMTGTHWAPLNDTTSNTLAQFRTLLASDANLAAFTDVTKSLQSNLTNELAFEIPALAGASLTVGYVVWMLRGGLLITSLLAQVPAWSIVDPLAVLDSLDKSDEDDESIGSLVEQGQSELEPVM